MTLKHILSIAALGAATIAFGQGKIVTTSLEVDGLCGMCKERIENAAYIKGVKQVEWSIETHELALAYNSEKVNEKDIIASINAVGHDVAGSPASAEQYANIHGCCRYRDPELRAQHGLKEHAGHSASGPMHHAHTEQKSCCGEGASATCDKKNGNSCTGKCEDKASCDHKAPKAAKEAKPAKCEPGCEHASCDHKAPKAAKEAKPAKCEPGCEHASCDHKAPKAAKEAKPAKCEHEGKSCSGNCGSK